MPVIAVLFSQGVNERQTAANKIGDGGLQDKINEESLHGRGGLNDLFQRLEVKPFWAGRRQERSR